MSGAEASRDAALSVAPSTADTGGSSTRGEDLKLLRPNWHAPSNVHAAFTLRSSDDPATVNESHRRLRQVLSLPGEPAWLEQVHGIEVVNLDRTADGKPRADASFTRTPGRVCVVRVADCMPVLFAQKDGKAVAAAHAGWRGLVAGILEATVEALGSDPAQLCAWMGPTIGPAHFEVGDEVRAAFVSGDSRAPAAFTQNARGRWQCDLEQLARQRLSCLGIGEISGGGSCTYADPIRFYSYRRTGTTARMAALIWME